MATTSAGEDNVVKISVWLAATIVLLFIYVLYCLLSLPAILGNRTNVYFIYNFLPGLIWLALTIALSNIFVRMGERNHLSIMAKFNAFADYLYSGSYHVGSRGRPPNFQLGPIALGMRTFLLVLFFWTIMEWLGRSKLPFTDIIGDPFAKAFFSIIIILITLVLGRWSGGRAHNFWRKLILVAMVVVLLTYLIPVDMLGVNREITGIPYAN